jgi:hypothetical protein
VSVHPGSERRLNIQGRERDSSHRRRRIHRETLDPREGIAEEVERRPFEDGEIGRVPSVIDPDTEMTPPNREKHVAPAMVDGPYERRFSRVVMNP